MRTTEIRQRWIDYFAANNHEIRPSVPLLSPEPSILFTIAGMVPFIPYITGEEEPPWPRVASVQKCIRTNDIENVGHTSRHGTFFQMNGNFSFGDYFKEGAIHYAFDLLSGSVEEGKYGLDANRLWVTIWDGDSETFDILTKQIGLDPAHIVRLPKEENFWDTGQPGPAGPCCEWHYDRGPAYGPEAEAGVDPGGDRYLELWNLVFDQYIRGEGEGKKYPLLHELERKAIDTGAGLERLAFILQDKANMFEIDEVRPVIDRVEEMTGRHYGANPQDDVQMRIIADHIRSSMMLINDGVRPGNDGAGYVLRRIMRRAVRSVKLLGFDATALPELMPVSRDAMSPSYPDLVENWGTISDIAYGEEASFRRTLDSGTLIFEAAASKAEKSPTGDTKMLSGKDAFALHDTYGFPIDLTLEMAQEKGLKVDEAQFRTLMAEQKERARADALSKKTGHADVKVYHQLAEGLGGGSTFVGYDSSSAESEIAGLLVGGQSVPVVEGPAQVDVILTRTPFYAEAGGQLADHGYIRAENGTQVEVLDVQSPIKGLSVHRASVPAGTIAVGDRVYAEIDRDRRLAIARAHTSTHMVHKALHEVVSESATQAGSENSPSRMRLDFRHDRALSESQLGEVEGLVNEKLMDDLEIIETVMPLEEAKAAGAMALFGEKYGKDVRVVSIGGDWSMEICLGTHVPSTGHIGRLNVLSESSIGSGVRRIDALVSDSSYQFQAAEHTLVSQLTGLLHGQPSELPEKVSGLLDRIKSAEKQLAALQSQVLLSRAAEIASGATKIDSVLLARSDLGTVTSSNSVREVAVEVRNRLGNADPVVVVVGAIAGEKPSLVVATNQAAQDRGLRAGDLVRAGAKAMGGGGGGKPDLAQGGGADPNKLQQALEAAVAQLSGVRS